MLRITTQSGSVYHVCLTSKTWARVYHDRNSSGLRNEHGKFNEVLNMRIGLCMMLICDPLDKRCSFRLIETTIITGIARITGPYDIKVPLMLADISAVPSRASSTTLGENPGQTPLYPVVFHEIGNLMQLRRFFL